MGYTDNVKRVYQYINKNFKTQQLLVKFHGIHVAIDRTFRCPYHDDNRKSAKLFKDAFHCWGCGRQYKPYHILKNNGYSFSDMVKMVPEDFEYLKEDIQINDAMYKAYVFSFREEFKRTGDIRKLIKNWNTIIDDNPCE
jgi:hypothetical protein